MCSSIIQYYAKNQSSLYKTDIHCSVLVKIQSDQLAE